MRFALHLIALLALLAGLSACALSPPLPPDCEGSLVQINAPSSALKEPAAAQPSAGDHDATRSGP